MLLTRCWLAALTARRYVRVRACITLLYVRSQVRRLSPKYQSGLLPESQGAGALQAGSAPHATPQHGSACAQARGSLATTLQACCCMQAGSTNSGPFSVRKWRFAVENGSERRLRRGRSRPRGLVVTVSGAGAVFFDVGC